MKSSTPTPGTPGVPNPSRPVPQGIDALINQPVYFKTTHGRFVRANDLGAIDTQGGLGPWEVFTIIKRAENQYAVRTHSGTYWKAISKSFWHPFGQLVQENYIGNWELFDFVPEGEYWAIKTHHGSFVRAGLDGEINTQKGMGAWEKFIIAAVPPENPDPLNKYLHTDVALQTHDGNFLRAGELSGNVNTQNSVGPRESSIINNEKHPGGPTPGTPGVPTPLPPVPHGIDALINQPVYFKTTHGRFVRANDLGDIDTQGGLGPWEVFTIIKRAENQYAVRTHSGTYWKAIGIWHLFGLLVQENYIGNSELFDFVPEGEYWAIKTHHGSFVRAGLDGEINTQNGIGAWEKFIIAAVPPENPDPLEKYLHIDVALQTHDGKFIHAGEHLGNVNTQNSVGPWESFTFVPQENGLFAIRTAHNTYLQAEKYGDVNQVRYIGDWAKFKFLKLSNGYAIKTAHDTYLRSCGNNFNQQNYLGPMEVFQIVSGFNSNLRYRNF